MLRRFRIVVLALSVGACATPQLDSLRPKFETLPPSAHLTEPAFFAQRTRECGPAALAMALVQSGVPADPDALVAEVYTPGRGGTLAPAIVAGARRHGRVAYPVNDLADLFAHLREGRPVIVLQNLGLDWIPQWHFAVAVGYDLQSETLILHSGTTAFLRTPLNTFERTWRRGAYWGLALLRPGEIPATASEPQFVRAVAGVERAGHFGIARESYSAAVSRWPDSLNARMGVGNTAYRLGELDAAARAFDLAARRHPKSADAFNNLAHVLAELGRYADAEQAAIRAVSLGGSRAETYRQTLEGIEAARTSGDRSSAQ